MRLLSRSGISVLVAGGFASPTLAGNWGEDWGSMTWGAVAAVPTMGWLAGALLVGVLAGLGMRRSSRRGGSVLALLLAFALAPVAEAQTVTVPNTMTNGAIAEAEPMNENFTTLEDGVNAALTTSSVTVPYTFTNGTTADADQVNANFSELENGVNAALANRETDCEGAGGTWDTATSSCTPEYSCFIGGYCSAVFAALGDTNVPNSYAGDTPDEGAAAAAGCNAPLQLAWQAGVDSFTSALAAQVLGPLNMLQYQLSVCE